MTDVGDAVGSVRNRSLPGGQGSRGRRRVWLTGPAVLLIVLLTSCSGGGNEPSMAPTAAPTTGSTTGPTADPTADPTAGAAALAPAPTSDPAGDLAASLAAAATTPVPAPGGGDITTEVEAGQQELLDPVAIGTAIDVDDRVTARILEVARTRGEARTAGEIAGPAVQLRVLLTNESRRPLSLRGVTVTAHDGDNLVLTPLGSAPSRPFRGRVAAGRDAEGVYVFTLPRGGSAPFTITVNYAADAPVAVFVGDLA
jgi:hypothetical protein